MDIKELNKLIPDSLKLEIKNFAAKFNAAPIVQPTATPVATPVATPAPAQFGEGMLEDGVTVIKYNTPTLAEGSVVTVVTPEGEMNAPEGEHKLQDGTVITVAVEGGVSVVKSVTKPEVVEEVAPAAEMQNVISHVSGFSEQLKTFASEKETMVQKFAAQEQKIEEQKKEIEALNTKVSEFFQLFVKVMELPSGQPSEQPRNKFAKSVDEKAGILSKFNQKN